MAPLPPRDLSLAEVKQLLVNSEGAVSAHRPGEGAGHAYGRHVALTREALWDRVPNEGRAGKIALFTAFISSADQIAAAAETLNSVEGKWARNQFHQAPPTPQHPRGPHNGMWAEIQHVGRPRNVRYAGGTGVMPASVYLMILARDDSRPLGLHVKTFYATVWAETPARLVKVFTRNNAPFSQGP